MYSNEPYEPPQRNRRVNRYSSEQAAVRVETSTGGKAKKKADSRKKRPLFREWQIAVMIVLGIALIVTFISFLSSSAALNAADIQLAGLRDERRQQEEAYAREVASYKTGYREYVEKYAAEYHLQPAFVAAVISCESSYNKDAVSRLGARGLMQFMPDTGSWIAGKLKLSGYTDDSLFDPEINIRFGCWYLNYLSGLFQGDPTVVACAYHAGQGNVRNWVKKYSTDGVTIDLDTLPDSVNDTKTYVRRVLHAYAIYQQHYYQN